MAVVASAVCSSSGPTRMVDSWPATASWPPIWVPAVLEALIAQGRRAWPTVMLLGAIAVVTALVTLINPYGLELHRWLLGSLGASRPEILEWRPPELLSFVWPAWWLMVAIFVAAILFTRRPRDLTHAGDSLSDAVAGL